MSEQQKNKDFNTPSPVGALANRSMPESLAAEAAVLGSMLIDPQCIGEVVEELDREAFYRIEHRYIFDALICLFEKGPVMRSDEQQQSSGENGHAIDPVLLRDELEKRKHLEESGGVEYIARLMDSVPSSANVLYYAGIVKDKALLREVIGAASSIIEDAFDPTGETSQKLDETERKIFSVTNKSIKGSAAHLKDLVTRAYELIETREGKTVTGLATGFRELDEKTCGLQNGEMIVIAGRPSMGKTAFALNIAEHIGVIEKIPLAIFSLEMGRQQLAERFLCSGSEIESRLVRKGILKTEDYQKLVEVCGVLSEAPIYVDDTSSLSPLQFRAKARRLKSMHNIGCVIIDYLQLMHLGSGRVESRQQEITTISRYIKALARELNIPVIVLSQLNRAPEGREGHRPRMSDLRESGSIEQDADVIMLLHRENYYRRGEENYEENDTAELIIAKQRNGPTGNIPLIFREEFTRFENASRLREPKDFESASKEEEVPF